jgi:nucleoside-diphosphate-sugar epimerase
MARVALLCPDLLFGSKVEGALAAAGHQVTRHDSPDAARAAAAESDVLVVDLTDASFGGAALGGEDGVRTLAFYSHVDVEARRAAEEAGFDLVVPRSRMARETAALVERLTA